MVSRLPAAIAACQAAMVVLVLVDLATAPGAAPPLVAIAVVGLGIGAAAGALLGAAAAALGRWRPSAATAVALGLAATVWIAGHAGLLIGVGGRFHDPALMALLMVAASFALLGPAAIVFVPARRGLARLGRWPTLGLGALLAVAAAVVVLPDGRALAAVGAATAAGAAARWAWRRRRPRLGRAAAAGWALATLAALAAALSPLGDDPRVQRGEVVPAATAWLRPLLDRDGDGSLAVLGDGDCAEGDATRSPIAIEVPDDGVDQDCRHGDLRAWPVPAPAPAAPAATAIVLVTLDGVEPGDELAALPGLAARIDAGIRFDAAHGLAGPLARIAPVLLSGRLTGADEAGGGFATDGAALPLLFLDAGWQVGVASSANLSRLTTVFPEQRSKWKKDGAVAARAAVSLLSAERTFVWLHVKVKRDDGGALDRGLADVFAAAAARGEHRVLVATAGGAPIALLGAGGPRAVTAPVGALDVYPTLLALGGLAEPTLDGRPPAIGRSLAGELAPAPVIAGYLGDRRDRLVEVPPAGGDGLRDGVLGPGLRWRNLRRAAGLLAATPDDLTGEPATIAGALEVRGCTRPGRDDRRVEIGIVLSGGEHLRPDDLVEVMLKSAGIRVFAVARPLDGALPFGAWPRGALVEHTVVVHRGLLGEDDPVVWVSIVRGDTRLEITRGEGASRDAVPVCAVEL